MGSRAAVIDELEISAMIKHRLTRQDQSEAQAILLTGACEWPEQRGMNFPRDTRPCIIDFYNDFTGLNGGRNSNFASVWHRLNRVHHQIKKDTLHAGAFQR